MLQRIGETALFERRGEDHAQKGSRGEGNRTKGQRKRRLSEDRVTTWADIGVEQARSSVELGGQDQIDHLIGDWGPTITVGVPIFL